MPSKSPRLHDDIGDYGVLECLCGSRNLHHFKIDIYEREEDARSGHHTQVSGFRTVIDQDMSGNPSSRRDGLVIRFWCENCETVKALTITQHKGDTQLAFMDTYEPRPA
jgi:hypothetical protein